MSRWKPGQSGNPKGRKPGSGKVAYYRSMLQADAEELIQIAVAQAKAGDPAALRLCIDRLIPPYKPEAIPVEFAIPEAGGLVKMGDAVLSAIGNGSLSPDQGTAILQALVGQAKLIEVEELTKRIEAIEEANAKS